MTASKYSGLAEKLDKEIEFMTGKRQALVVLVCDEDIEGKVHFLTNCPNDTCNQMLRIVQGKIEYGPIG